MQRGYIKIWRKLEDSGLLQMHSTLAMFMYMLMKANHKPSKFGLVDVGRGELISGRFKLAEHLGLSERNVRTCLQHLHDLNMITSKPTNKFTVYTIVNYGQYQDIDTQTDQPAVQPSTNNRPTTDQQPTTSKELKHLNIKEINHLSEYSDEFEQFWNAYPKKTGKGGAYTSWKKQKPKLTDVLTALSWQTIQPDWVKENGQFVPMPATYLNQRRWEDECKTPKLDQAMQCPKGFPFSEWMKASQQEKQDICRRNNG